MKLRPGMVVRLGSGTILTDVQRVGQRTTKWVGKLPTGRGYLFTTAAVEEACGPTEWAARRLAEALSGGKQHG